MLAVVTDDDDNNNYTPSKVLSFGAVCLMLQVCDLSSYKVSVERVGFSMHDEQVFPVCFRVCQRKKRFFEQERKEQKLRSHSPDSSLIV